ncbi:methyltransferase [Aurantimonas aggregata]|uniref:Methyltransferase n=1 Tax=Aurantimonas aggregata TaxID=2047720 RepID=A0A6L9MDV5_9HYPH|nr:methyltransferase [Aurantimonas aggregata]NDV86004.1 methyltransferase [Aurantimonas aggregata]
MNFPDAPSVAAGADTLETRCDAFYDGRFALLQPVGKGYRSGLDALLLAATVPSAALGAMADVGAGAGAVGIAAACRSDGVTVTLVEKSPAMAELARGSVALPANARLAPRLAVVEADILATRPAREAAGLADGAFQFVLTNPPFYPDGHRASPDRLRAEALTGTDGQFLPAWIKGCAALLANGGRFVAVLPPAALSAVLGACDGRLGGIHVLPIHAREDTPAVRLLVSGRKGSRAPLALLPGRFLHEPDGALSRFGEDVGSGLADIMVGV